MIFLFNSGSRSTYLDNVFSTLYKPVQMINTYQYNCEGVDSHIDYSALPNYCKENDDVLITYIDKLSNDNIIYFPLRLGKLIKCEIIDGRIYYEVLLTQYCHTECINKFNLLIKNKLDNKVYHKNKDWEGSLAIRANININNAIQTTEESWIRTVKLLSERNLFIDNYSIFTRVELFDSDNNKLETKKINNNYMYSLKGGKEYVMLLSYFNNYFNNNPMTKIHLSISDDKNTLNLSNKVYEIGNKQSVFRIPLKTKKSDKKEITSFNINIKENKILNKDVKYSTASIPIASNNKFTRTLKNILIVVFIILIALSTWISTLSIKDIIDDVNLIINSGQTLSFFQNIVYKLCIFLSDNKYSYNVICSLITTLSTVGLIHFYGKAKV